MGPGAYAHPMPFADVFLQGSMTSEEGPKPGVDPNLTFGKGPENLSIVFSISDSPSKARVQN